MSKAYIGAGGNLGDASATLSSAFALLEQNLDINSIALSAFYLSKPLNDANQPQYINAVAEIETHLTPECLLTLLQETEQCFGRVRTDEQWSSRTLDLDILLYDELQISTEHLTIPHSGMLVRDFVLQPLYEIAPDLVIPGYGSLAGALDACEIRGLIKIPVEKTDEHNC
ncbi:MAG: 2-amino-4-hydroxy-6-hydroxymethyldihydropteridine diphosphokinase [Gammaproteobacteria bacterium]|nr:2-amino-4-hydroxy-6-hydroxymethyldihydropteridine diphosphokinase [Gammaproteobacteria bacterium]